MARRLGVPPAAFLILLLLSTRPADGIPEGGSSGRDVPTVISPVRDLEPSLAASAAQGTVVAVVADGFDGGRRSGECAVILARSHLPSSASAKNLTTSVALRDGSGTAASSSSDPDDPDDDAPSESVPPLMPLPRGPVAFHEGSGSGGASHRKSRTLHVLNDVSGLTCALTGFASDVRHLVRVAARHVSEHDALYGGGSAEALSVHSVARDVLASAARDAAFGSSGRPYGAQALLVGNRFVGSGGRDGKSSKDGIGGGTLQIYTVDPAGGWRHWGGGGSAVGRKAETVRRGLCDALRSGRADDGERRVGDLALSSSSSSSPPPRGGRPKSWREALDVAMRALIEAAESDDDADLGASGGVMDDRMGGQYDAVVVVGGRSGRAVQSRCFAIESEVVKSSYRRCRQRIAASKTSL